MAEKTLDEILEQAGLARENAWYAVYDLCKELGMNLTPRFAPTGKECVLNFIKELHAKANKQRSDDSYIIWYEGVLHQFKTQQQVQVFLWGKLIPHCKLFQISEIEIKNPITETFKND